MGGRQPYQVPDGFLARGFRFEVEPTSPEQPAQLARHFGARRFAYNWALAQIKANLDARAADPAIPRLAWDFYDLRRAGNQGKHRSRRGGASGLGDLRLRDRRPGHRPTQLVGFQARPPSRRQGRVPPVQGPPS
jgi:hypothetical protein